MPVYQEISPAHSLVELSPVLILCYCCFMTESILCMWVQVERSSLLTDSATCQPPATSEKNGESASVQPTQETISAPDTASVLPKMKSRSKSQSRRHGMPPPPAFVIRPLL